MTNVNVEQIKRLRQQTGAGIMEIKQALQEAAGDPVKAQKILKEKGKIKAGKKASRETAAGIVEAYIHANKTCGAIVVLSCETDFVARNDQFQKLAHEIAMQVCAMKAKDNKELSAQPWIRDENKTIGELILEAIAKFGENIKIEEFTRLEIGYGS
jgi:elongation factor Ts